MDHSLLLPGAAHGGAASSGDGCAGSSHDASGAAPAERPPAGLARDAAAAARLAGGKEVGYFDLPCRTILNRCSSERMPFEWTINPYRGCEFGCTYCYARYTHEYLGLEDPLDFERRIFVKRDAARALERELAAGRAAGESIAIGTATDPYQPAERRFRVTRGILEVLARARGLGVSITTKSSLVVRDLDLLRVLAARGRLRVNVSVTTLDRRLARLLEPRATTPEKRFQAIEALAAAGIETAVFLMPILPGITDSEASLEAVIARAARAGAREVGAQVLFLAASARRRFFPFLRERFPERYRAYRAVYGGSMYHRESYRAAIRERVARLRRRHGLAPRDREGGEPAGGRDGGAPARHEQAGAAARESPRGEGAGAAARDAPRGGPGERDPQMILAL
jgi:DNA repair photolyase